MIQLVFLLFTSNSGGEASNIVLFSMAMSFINLTASICGDDAQMLQISFSGKNVWGDSVRMQFIALYAFRILGITSELILYAMLWYCVSGFACIAVLLVDLAVAVAQYLGSKQL